MIYENRTGEAFSMFPLAGTVMSGGQTFMNHCHQELELILVRRGKVEMTCEGRQYVLDGGAVLIIPPFASHSIEGGSEDSQRLAILMDLKIAGWMNHEDERRELGRMLEQRDLYSGHWEPEVRERVREIIEGMFAEYQGMDKGWTLAVKTCLNELLLTVYRRTPPCPAVKPDRKVEKLRRILEYVAMHYCLDISLEGCAAAAGFNPTYLSRYFHQNMGMTFQEYVKRLRIDRARWLLTNVRTSVTEIAYACGFKDIKTFNKLFKKECGVSPTQFRKNVKICVL